MWPFESKRTKEIKKVKKSIYEKLVHIQISLDTSLPIVDTLVEDGFVKLFIRESLFGHILYVQDKSFMFSRYAGNGHKIIAYHIEGGTPIGIVAFDANIYRNTEYLDGYTDKTILPMLHSINKQLDYFIEYTKSPDFLTKLNKKMKKDRVK